MNKVFLTAVSAIAIMAAGPALADTEVKAGMNADASVTPGSAEAAAQSTGDVSKDVEKAWEDIKDDTSKAYKDIKASLLDEDSKNLNVSPITINTSTTAAGMIGQPVVNGEERVGKIKDIILDNTGKATMVIVADGDFFGTGKLAAFDYSTVMNVNAEGDVIAPLNEASIDQAAEFSYEPSSDESVRVMPGNGFSTSALLDGQLTNSQGKTLGQVDDIRFESGTASHLIIGFNQVLGLGGKNAAIAYNSADIVKDGNGYDFRLTAAKSAQFENYKENATN